MIYGSLKIFKYLSLKEKSNILLRGEQKEGKGKRKQIRRGTKLYSKYTQWKMQVSASSLIILILFLCTDLF